MDVEVSCGCSDKLWELRELWRRKIELEGEATYIGGLIAGVLPG